MTINGKQINRWKPTEPRQRAGICRIRFNKHVCERHTLPLPWTAAYQHNMRTHCKKWLQKSNILGLIQG